MRFLVVDASTSECPYLPDRQARMPLRAPLEDLSPDDFDALLAEGDRRAGPFLYRTACDGCVACEALRVPVARFAPTRSQRRAVKKNEDLRVELGLPTLTARHVELYNRHKFERGLARDDEPTTPRTYQMHLLESCVDTREVRYLDGDRLIAVSILDFGRTSCSSVYHFFDPDEAERSLGVFSVVKEIELCRDLGLDWYYLGLWVRDCSHLAYKSGYFPHQRLLDGRWQEFEGARAP